MIISKELTGGIEFDLGNSPREFVRSRIEGKTIVMSTTNGTRALCACFGAARIRIGSFFNLQATVDAVRGDPVRSLLLICAGTENFVAYEDVLCAGAFIDLLLKDSEESGSDSAQIARAVYLREQNNLLSGLSKSRNAKRLLAYESLQNDVAYCAQCDIFSQVVEWKNGEMIR
jgi:2-phosphosulfolactate phosphatase